MSYLLFSFEGGGDNNNIIEQMSHIIQVCGDRIFCSSQLI